MAAFFGCSRIAAHQEIRRSHRTLRQTSGSPRRPAAWRLASVSPPRASCRTCSIHGPRRGIYVVTGFIDWRPAGGTLPVADGIGHRSEASAGILTVSVRLFPSEGGHQDGVLTANARLPNETFDVEQGITLAVDGFLFRPGRRGRAVSRQVARAWHVGAKSPEHVGAKPPSTLKRSPPSTLVVTRRTLRGEV